jgi:hypothetical protein
MAKNISDLNKSLLTTSDYTDNTDISIDTDYSAKIGALDNLKTSNKGSLVAAINEVFQSGTNAKQQLVDALVAKGVTCSTSDSWDTLMNHINEGAGGGLDIISATELPNTGRENQICVIMENPINKYSILPYTNNTYTSDSVTLVYGADESNYTYRSNNQIIQYNFNRVTKDGVNFKSYYWQDSKWNILTYDYVGIVENGVTPVPGGNLQLNSHTSYFNFIEAGDEDYIRIPSSGSYNHITSTSTPINFNLYSRVEVDAKALSGSSKSLYIGFSTAARSAAQTASSIKNYCTKYTSPQSINKTTTTTYTYDISSFTGTGYLVLFTNMENVQLGIVNVRLYP